MKPLWTRNFLCMCLSCFFQFMTHYALLTVLPIFIIDILQHTNQEAGLAVTFFMIGTVLCRPFAGKWIDKFEKRKFLLLSLGLFLLASVSYMGVESIFFLMLLRFIHGVGFGMGTTATSTIAAILAPENRRGEGIGYLAMFTSLAMVLGPFLSLMIVIYSNFSILFGVCGVLGLLAFVCGYITRIPSDSSKSEKINNLRGWQDYIEPKALPVAIIGFFLAIVYGGILTFIPIYARSMGLTEFAGGFFVVYAIAIVLPRPIIGRLFDRKGANSITYPAIFLFVLGMIGLSQIHGPVGLLVSGLIIGLGFGGLHPSFQAMAVQACSDQRKGLATATYFLFFDIGIGVGSYVLGLLVLYTNYQVMYLVSSVVMAFTAVLYYCLCHNSCAESLRLEESGVEKNYSS